MTFTLAIVGRPNVGKSTLFNRLVGRRLALVDDQPGVTRDLREGEARLGPLRFTVIDTAGLEEATDESLQGRMRKLTERAVAMADVCLFMIDARAGVMPADRVFADDPAQGGPAGDPRRQQGRGQAGGAGLIEAYELGLGEPLALSAEHGEGMGDLLSVLMPVAEEFADRAATEAEQAPEVDVDLAGRDRRIRRCGSGEGLGPERQEAVADRRGRPSERRKVDADQQDPGRRAAADRARGRHHPRRDFG